MLNYRLHRSMDLIAEGIDTGDVRLILKESAAFQSAFNELKTSIDDFVKLIGEVGLEGLKEPYVNLDKLVGEAEQSIGEMPDDWSWQGQIDTLKKPSGDSPPETLVSQIALSHDTNVNACKDAVIEIAKYLEANGKGLFNVGSAGLSLTEEFKSVLKVEQFRLAQLLSDDFMFELVQVEKGSDQNENEKSVKEAWKPFWDPQDKGEEKNWTDFQNIMEKLATGIPQLWKDCGQVVQNGKPSDDFQSQAPKEGLLKSLLGGLFGNKSPTNIDPVKVMGSKEDDAKGLLGMPFENLSALVVGLLEMSGAATAAASGAVEAIDDNQEELEDKMTSIELRDQLLKGYGESMEDLSELKDKAPKTAKALGAFEGIFGKDKDIKVSDIRGIDPKELVTKLTDTNLKEYMYQTAEIEGLFEALGIELTEDPEDAEAENTASPLDVLADIDEIPDDDKEEWLDTAEQEDLIDGEGEAKEDNTPEEVKDIVGMIVDDLSDEQEEELESSLLPEEEGEKVEETFRRWGKLAGIITS